MRYISPLVLRENDVCAHSSLWHVEHLRAAAIIMPRNQHFRKILIQPWIRPGVRPTASLGPPPAAPTRGTAPRPLSWRLAGAPVAPTWPAASSASACSPRMPPAWRSVAVRALWIATALLVHADGGTDPATPTTHADANAPPPPPHPHTNASSRLVPPAPPPPRPIEGDFVSVRVRNRRSAQSQTDDDDLVTFKVALDRNLVVGKGGCMCVCVWGAP